MNLKSFKQQFNNTTSRNFEITSSTEFITGSGIDPAGFLGTLALTGSFVDYKPQTSFNPDKTYLVTINTGVIDENGNKLDKQVSYSFSTIPDTIPPKVLNSNTIPLEASIVEPTTRIVIPFDEAMEESTLIANIKLYIVDNANNEILTTTLADSYSFSYDPITYTVIYIPKQVQTPSLAFGTKYKISISGVTDIYNNALKLFDLNFTTSQISDTILPSVLRIYPKEGATASAKSKIRILFSEPMLEQSITPNLEFYEFSANGPSIVAPLPYLVELNLALDTATLTPLPTLTLTPSSRYRVVVKGGPAPVGVRDVAGNILQTDISSDFKISQSNEWTFVSGSTTTSTNSTAGPTYTEPKHPGSKGRAMSWIDLEDNLWVFGGMLTSTMFNDLWMYDTVTSLWTEVGIKREQSVEGIYLGDVKSHYPGSRRNGTTWVDKEGKFWLFGGMGFASGGPGVMNDLWMYDPKLRQWTWVGGSNITLAPGNYTAKPNIVSPNSLPPGREGATTWVDNNGDLWLFGGGENGSAIFNDLWKYIIADNVWIWVAGSKLRYQQSVYLESATELAVPSSRMDSSGWVDKQGLLWIYGGNGLDETASLGSTDSSELWTFDTITNKWTFYINSPKGSTISVAGEFFVSDKTYHPSSRDGAVTWLDSKYNLWLFGGSFHKDLWKFDGQNWALMKGNDIAGGVSIFPILGRSSSTSNPGGNIFGTGWIDSEDNLWFFGGNVTPTLTRNVLWKYTP